jgi:hypothetical protein
MVSHSASDELHHNQPGGKSNKYQAKHQFLRVIGICLHHVFFFDVFRNQSYRHNLPRYPPPVKRQRQSKAAYARLTAKCRSGDIGYMSRKSSEFRLEVPKNRAHICNNAA